MRFRNSLRLLMENFKQVYKLLFAKFVIGLVATALCCAFILPELIQLLSSAEVSALVTDFKEFFKAITATNFAEVKIVRDRIFSSGGSLSKVGTLLSSMTLEIVLTVVGCVVVYLLKRFAETLCHFTAGSMLNDKMSTYAEQKYSASLVANLGKASVYSVVYVPLVFAYDVVMLCILWALLTFLPIFAGLFFAITALVLLQTLKLTLTSAWLPAMTADGKKLREAIKIKDGKEKSQKFKTFSNYLISVYLIIIVNVIAALCTFGSALIITIPASYFFLICQQYVNYYTVTGKRYFLTYEQIATNPDHGDSEHYFDYIAEEDATVEETNE